MSDYVRCSSCGQRVSNVVPAEVVVRAFVSCPTCIDKYENDLADLIDGLTEVYKPEGVGIWLLGANKRLDGATPIDAWKEGRQKEVLALVTSMQDGNAS